MILTVPHKMIICLLVTLPAWTLLTGSSAGQVRATSTPSAGMSEGAPDGGPPLPPAPAANPVGHLHKWSTTPSDVASGIVRATDETVVTDAPFDDHGADTNPADGDPTDYVNGSTFCGTPAPCFGQGGNAKDGYVPGVTGGANGDYHYPAQDDVYARNAADIVEVRAAIDATNWYLLVRLNTLIDPTTTAIEAKAGGKSLLLHGQTGTFDGHAVTVVADAQQATFEARVPRSMFDPTIHNDELFVAAGLWNPTANNWFQPSSSGGSPYFDLAYVPKEEMTSYWRDAQQSTDILFQSYANDSIPVDWRSMAARRCPVAGACPQYSGPTSGLFSRQFRSGQHIGEGVAFQTRYSQDSGAYTRNVYKARYQPYAIYRPQHPTGAMVLLLHHLGGSYMAYSITAMPALSAWAEKLGVTIVMPEGRGEGGWYEGEAEKDAFEAWRDAAQHYSLDRERVYLAGMSMGGYGTWRLSQLYPDLFARGIIWAGLLTTPDDNLQLLFGNTRNVPLMVVHGALDPLVPAPGPEAWMPDYAAKTTGDFRYYFYPSKSHETNFPGTTGPHIVDFLSGLPARERNPVSVTYTLRRSYLQPSFGISYDGAYWAHGMILAKEAKVGRVEANRARTADTVKPLTQSVGADALGVYRLTGQDVTRARPLQNFVTLTATGLSRAGLNTTQMGWSRAAQRIVGETDQPMDLIVHGDYARALRVTGAPAAQVHSQITVHLPKGTFDVSIMPLNVGNSTGESTGKSTGSSRLPATGLPIQAPLLALTALVGASLLRRRQTAKI